jgi:TatD DNase family protein
MSLFKLIKKFKTFTNMQSDSYKLFDIAANLCDEKFKGIYHGKKYHEDDTEDVIKRAHNFNVEKMLFASGSIDDLHDSYSLASKGNDYYTTIGIHPCRASVIYS